MPQRLCNSANAPWSVSVLIHGDRHMHVEIFLFLFFIFIFLDILGLANSRKPVESQRSSCRFSSSIGLGHMANTQPMLPEPFLRTIFRDPLPFFLSTQSNSPFPPVISAQPVVRYGAWRTAQAIFCRPLECSTDALERKGNEDCKILEIGALGRKTQQFWSEAVGNAVTGLVPG